MEAVGRTRAAAAAATDVMIIKTGLKALPHLYMDTKGMAGAPPFGMEFRELLSQLRPAIRRKRLAVARELVRPPLTLCHGDAHPENIFFAEHFEGGCMFIDFGLTAFGQALGDVAMVVAAGMRPDVRRAHELASTSTRTKGLTFGKNGGGVVPGLAPGLGAPAASGAPAIGEEQQRV